MKRIENLHRLLNPRHIVVIGGKMAVEVVRQLDKIEYAGEVWGMNPNRDELAGRPCFPSLADLPTVPDAAYIAVPRGQTVEMVRQLNEMGVAGAVCYASGFAEVGEEGRPFQTALQEAMGEMAIVGPNCYGILNYFDGVTLWPDEHGGKRVEQGAALVGQSGNMMISFSMQQRAVPIGYLISTGNQAGLTIPDYVAALLQDERVRVIGLHIEGLDDVVTFSEVALAALQKKVPIVVLKTGSSELGGQVAMSHTSSLAGSDELYDALFKRLGVMRVTTMPQMLEALKFLSVVGPLPGRNIASISCSGGEAALMADTAVPHNLTFPPLTNQQTTQLQTVLDERVALGNPLDYHTYIWGNQAEQTRCFAAMLDGDQDVTMKVLDFPRPDLNDLTNWRKTAVAFANAVKQTRKKGVVVATLQENLPGDIADWLLAQGIAPMLGVDECMTAVSGAATIYQAQQRADKLRPITRFLQPQGVIKPVVEQAGKQLLHQFGFTIPDGRMVMREVAVVTANRLGYPLALKTQSADIAHKSDVGGVKLNLQTAVEVTQAIDQMSHLGDHFLLEKMAPPPLVEMILGVVRDPQFGLALVVGAGGVLVELFQDSQTLLLPLNDGDVEAALDRLKIAPLLNGYRGQPAADRAAIVTAVHNLANFANDYEEILFEVDINPLFVYAKGCTAVDAFIQIQIPT